MAPKTPLAARTPAYLAQYGRTLGAAYRFERIQKEVGDEQARVQYLDSLIGQERQTLAGLQQVLATPPADFAAMAELLDNVRIADAEAEKLRKRGAANVEQQKKASNDDRAFIAEGVTIKGDAPTVAQNFARWVESTNPTPERAKDAAKHAQTLIDKFADGEEQRTKASARVAAGTERAKGEVKGGVPSDLTQAQREARRALASAQQAAPSGIRGGPEAEAVVARRQLTSQELRERGLDERADALEDAGFATEQAALDAVLEGARQTGSITGSALGQQLYAEAQRAQAYRNDQAPDFSPEVLTSRQRLAQLEGERQSIASRYDDPAQEAIKRELMARGYKFAERGSPDEWMNRYIQYQNTPYYDVLLRADRLVDASVRENKPLGPSTKAQNMVTTLTMQYERTGTKFDLDTLRKQLEKAPDLSPAEVEDALGFIVAYRELGGDKQDPKQLEFLRKQEEFQKQSDEKRRQQAEAMKAEVDRARQVTRQLEAEQVQAVSALRTEQAKANLPGQEYARLRAMGMSPEEARAKAMQLAVPVQTAELAGKVLMEPDLLMERQRRIEAAREAAKAAPAPASAPEEITLRGGPIAVEAATAATPPAPAPTPAPAQPIARGTFDETGTFRETGTPFSYRKNEAGDFIVFKDGAYSDTVKAGSRAAQSIERVMAGQAPLPRTPAAPKPKPAATPAAKPATPAPAKPLTDEELLKKYGG